MHPEQTVRKKVLALALCLRNTFTPPDVIARRNDEAISLNSNALEIASLARRATARLVLTYETL